jgi:predicted nuclease of predicted toxin-antitoxin system
MDLYLDDNLDDTKLADLLRKAGHSVVRPADAGLIGASDVRHLAYAIANGFTILTSDREDFRDLHDLLRAAGGAHPGILVVRFDNDATRDMKPKQIVSAIGKLERSGVDWVNDLIVLNQWR